MTSKSGIYEMLRTTWDEANEGKSINAFSLNFEAISSAKC
jgi:hypothetical protein